MLSSTLLSGTLPSADQVLYNSAVIDPTNQARVALVALMLELSGRCHESPDLVDTAFKATQDLPSDLTALFVGSMLSSADPSVKAYAVASRPMLSWAHANREALVSVI